MTDATLVYDDDCEFCTRCAEYLEDRAPIEIVGFSELDADLRERLPEDYEDCSHLVTDDDVYSCGESVERAVLMSEAGEDLRPVAEFLRSFEEYEWLREEGYEFVADNRSFWSDLTSLIFGDGSKRDR